MRKISILSLALIALISFSSNHAFADNNDKRLITVTANGEAKAFPDKFTMSFVLSSEDKNLEVAKKQNDEATNKMLATLKNLGIEAEGINSTALRINPRYRYERDSGKQIFTGYRVERNIIITSKKVAEYERYVTAVVEAGAERFSGANFTISDVTKLEEQAISKAIENASKKAKHMAQSFGVKLGKVTNVSEGISSSQPVSNVMVKARYEGATMADAANPNSTPETMTGEYVVNAFVSVSYELE